MSRGKVWFYTHGEPCNSSTITITENPKKEPGEMVHKYDMSNRELSDAINRTHDEIDEVELWDADRRKLLVNHLERLLRLEYERAAVVEVADNES